jgi:LysM repeat protein
MHKKSIYLLIAVTILSLMLASCYRPASTPPPIPKVATSESAFPQSTSQGQSMNEILSATQTAAAVGAQPTEAPTAKPTKAPTTKPAKSSDENDNNSSGSSYQPNTNPQRPQSYTLQAGEWPICIARRYDLDVSSLLALNGLSMDSRPAAGTTLRIPQSGTWNSGNQAWHSHPTTYTVRAGDNVNVVACYFGNLLPEDVIGANNLSSPYTLTSGQTLTIP